ncbi:hypothetical protein F5Y01DRAFT_288443, partial [Xylaria sp. FL0043]
MIQIDPFFFFFFFSLSHSLPYPSFLVSLGRVFWHDATFPPASSEETWGSPSEERSDKLRVSPLHVAYLRVTPLCSCIQLSHSWRTAVKEYFRVL